MNKQIILVGPYPPPYHGTSIPLLHLDQFIQEKELAETIIVQTITRYDLPIYHPKIIRTYFLLIKDFVKALSGVEVVLITGSQGFVSTIGSILLLISKLLYKKQVSIYIHGGGYDQYFLNKGLAIRRVIRRVFSQADNLIVQTRQLGDALSPYFSNLSIVPNWTKISEIQEMIADKDPGHRQEPDEFIRFFYLGELRKEKGIRELIEVFWNIQERLEGSNRVATLDLFGQISPAFERTFEDLIAKSDQANIQYRGYIDHSELMGKLTGFDVLILPTFMPTEGYPGVIIEAMSAGIPVVTTRWRAIPEIVIDGLNGLLAEPEDQESLMECIVKLTLDDQLRSTLGANAKTGAYQFDTETVLPVLCELIGL